MKHATHRLAGMLCLVLALALPLGALAGEGEPQAMYVSNPIPTDRLYLREEATTSSTPLGLYYNGTVVEVLSPGEQFTYVLVGELTGYMLTEFLSTSRDTLELENWASVYFDSPNQKLRLRAGVAEGSVTLGLFPIGTAVQIREDDTDFYKVRTLAQEGYMSKQFILRDGDPGRIPLTTLTWGMVEPESLNLRSFPSREGLSLGLYTRGALVEILGTVGAWYYVEVSGPNGWAVENQRGFMLSQYIKVGNYNSNVSASSATYAVITAPSESDLTILRAQPMWSSTAMGIYLNGTQVDVLDTVETGGQLPTWVHVRVDGMEGYVQGSNLHLVDKTAPDTWPEIDASQITSDPTPDDVDADTAAVDPDETADDNGEEDTDPEGADDTPSDDEDEETHG